MINVSAVPVVNIECNARGVPSRIPLDRSFPTVLLRVAKNLGHLASVTNPKDLDYPLRMEPVENLGLPFLPVKGGSARLGEAR